MNNKILAMAGILLLLVFGAASVGCGEGNSAEASTDDSKEQKNAQAKNDGSAKTDDEDDEDTEEAVPVEVAALARGEIESILRFSSNLEAESQVDLSLRATFVS